MIKKNSFNPLVTSSSTFELESSGIKNGIIEKRFGKFGSENIKGMPSRSMPLKWRNIPEGTKSFALVMEDYDAIPVAGFSWIHWVAIIPGNLTELSENASLENKEIIQGVNSWISSLGGLTKAEAAHFGGPAPPDKDHTYSITLYALDKEIKLQEGFYLNQLYHKMKDHILDKITVEALYKSDN